MTRSLFKINRLATAFLVFMLAGSGVFADDSMQRVRIGTEGAYPPYAFINDEGEIDGFERDLGDQICEIARLDCVWVKNDWDSIIPNLLSGNYDTIIAGMSITPERRKVIDFTESYFPADPSAYIVSEGGSSDLLTKGTVAAQKSSIQASYVSESGAELVEFSTLPEAVSAVRSGEVDAVLADKGALEKIVKESNGKLKFVGRNVILGEGMGIGIRKNDVELKDKLNLAINAMKKDGSLDKLIVKWFDGKVVNY